MEHLAKSYILLASAFAAQSPTTLGEMDVFEDVEIKEASNWVEVSLAVINIVILGQFSYFSSTGLLYRPKQWGSTITHRVDDIAKRHPERSAVISKDGSIAS